MTRALAMLLLVGCAEAHTIPDGWRPLPCDVVEHATWATNDGDRTTITMRVTVVSIIEAPAAAVLIRTPQAETPDAGPYAYHGPSRYVVTDLGDGTTRAVCSETHTRRVYRGGDVYDLPSTAQTWLEGGEFLIRGTP